MPAGLTFPFDGPVLCSPLDSGLRRHDEGRASGFCRAATSILNDLFPTPSTTCIHAGAPSRGIPDILSIHNGGAGFWGRPA